MSDKKPDGKATETPVIFLTVDDGTTEWVSYVDPDSGERERVTLDHYRALGY